MWSSLTIGEKTISLISRSMLNSCHLSSSSGTRLPIIRGRNLPKHHICAAARRQRERNCSVQLVVINQIQHTQLLRTHIWRETTKDYKTGSLRIFSVYSDLHLLMIVPTRVLMNIIIIILLLLSLLLTLSKKLLQTFCFNTGTFIPKFNKPEWDHFN